MIDQANTFLEGMSVSGSSILNTDIDLEYDFQEEEEIKNEIWEL